MQITVLPGRVIDTGKAVHQPGATIEVSDSEGRRLIALKAASAVAVDKAAGAKAKAEAEAKGEKKVRARVSK